MDIGKINHLRVSRVIEAGTYLETAEGEVFLPRQYAPPGIGEGDFLDVMIYLDQKGKPVATTNKPIAQVGEIALMRVEEVNEHGAFMDWGLEKDLLLPHPEQLRPLRKGDFCVVHVMLDERNGRPMATAKIENRMNPYTSDLKPSQEVDLLVYGKTELGYKVVIDGRHQGLLFHDQTPTGKAYGDRFPGWINQVRPDGKVDVTAVPRGKVAREADEDTVLERLAAAGGFLPHGDKSDPDEIQRLFGMSKKRFKKAIGALYKAREIVIEPGGIRDNPEL